MTEIVFVFGTRPDVLKSMPVVEELQARGIVPRCILTGQHEELLVGTPLARALQIERLQVKSRGQVMRWLNDAGKALDTVRVPAPGSLVVVQGDVMSAYAGALWARRNGTDIAHIEAGVRSGAVDDPWPEERLRYDIDTLATWMYAPTERARNNLEREGRELTHILVTGNTSVSALARYTAAAPQATGSGIVVVTLHRRELTLDTERLRAVVDALMEAIHAHPTMRVLWPVHPSVSGVVFSNKPENLTFATPMEYVPFVETVARASGVLTDSGGLVEECTTLGVPCAVLRNVTDRPEAEACGAAQRFSTTPDGVRAAVEWLALPHSRQPHTVFGLPDAAARIAEHLAAIVFGKLAA